MHAYCRVHACTGAYDTTTLLKTSAYMHRERRGEKLGCSVCSSDTNSPLREKFLNAGADISPAASFVSAEKLSGLISGRSGVSVEEFERDREEGRQVQFYLCDTQTYVYINPQAYARRNLASVHIHARTHTQRNIKFCFDDRHKLLCDTQIFICLCTCGGA